MAKLESGEIIRYILGIGNSYQKIKKIIHETNNLEDAKSNFHRIEEGLESFHTMKQSNYRNKWKEGATGGAIAGALIVGLSPAISPVISFWGALFRLGSGVVAGTTASLAYNEISRNCSRENRRAIDVHILLQNAKNKLEELERSPQLSR